MLFSSRTIIQYEDYIIIFRCVQHHLIILFEGNVVELFKGDILL